MYHAKIKIGHTPIPSKKCLWWQVFHKRSCRSHCHKLREQQETKTTPLPLIRHSKNGLTCRCPTHLATHLNEGCHSLTSQGSFNFSKELNMHLVFIQAIQMKTAKSFLRIIFAVFCWPGRQNVNSQCGFWQRQKLCLSARTVQLKMTEKISFSCCSACD